MEDIDDFVRENRNVLERFRRVLDHDPIGKIARSDMAQSFAIWSKRLPLALKCDELARQMQERLFALQKVRDSYLRDVICVKHSVEKLAKYQFVKLFKY